MLYPKSEVFWHCSRERLNWGKKMGRHRRSFIAAFMPWGCFGICVAKHGVHLFLLSWYMLTPWSQYNTILLAFLKTKVSTARFYHSDTSTEEHMVSQEKKPFPFCWITKKKIPVLMNGKPRRLPFLPHYKPLT